MLKQIRTWLTILVAAAMLPTSLAEAAVKRSQSARVAFVRANACPSTAKNKLPCPGYIIDHVVPLCAGGADAPSNMQWQTVAAAKTKDIGEKQQCAKLRKAKQ